MLAIVITQNDTKEKFRDAGHGLTWADLAGCTLVFQMESVDGATTISQAAVIASDAAFEYEPVLSDVQTAGKFNQKWKVTFPSTKTLSYPNNGYNRVVIVPDLGD